MLSGRLSHTRALVGLSSLQQPTHKLSLTHTSCVFSYLYSQWYYVCRQIGRIHANIQQQCLFLFFIFFLSFIYFVFLKFSNYPFFITTLFFYHRQSNLIHQVNFFRVKKKTLTRTVHKVV